MKDIGQFTESLWLVKFLSLGYGVSIPWGDNLPYDLIIDNGNELKRIQCKTARLIQGSIVFNSNNYHRNSSGVKEHKYGDAFDYFAVYYTVEKRYFLLPRSYVKDVSKCYLSLKDQVANNIKKATDFEI